MKMIAQFIRALADIMRARKEKDYEQALVLIKKASRNYLDTDIVTLLKSTPEQILTQFRNESNQLDTERCFFAAELLYEIALMSQENHQHEAAQQIKVLSLLLFTSAIPKDKQFQSKIHLEKVATLLNDLKTLTLPPNVQAAISAYQHFPFSL